MYHLILLKTGQQCELTFRHLFMLLLNRSKATVVAVQQPLVECTAIFTMCTVYYRKLPTYLCCDNTQNTRYLLKKCRTFCLRSCFITDHVQKTTDLYINYPFSKQKKLFSLLCIISCEYILQEVVNFSKMENDALQPGMTGIDLSLSKKVF